MQANVLKALAGAPELAGEDIHTRTVYGVVSLTGSVRSEALQVRAEDLAANSPGVKKVVDEMAVGSTAATNSTPGTSAPSPGTSSARTGGQQVEAQQGAASATAGIDPAPGSAPASSAVMNNPERDQQQYQNQQESTGAQASASNGTISSDQQPRYGSASPAQTSPAYEGAPESRRYPDQRAQGHQTQNGRSGYATDQAPLQGGQEAGKRVIIPPDTLIRVRLNETVSSDRSAPGSSFDGVVMSDVIADEAIAIPRGAQVHGTVVSATRAGVLKGRGDLALALTSVSLGGQTYPLVTSTWAHHEAIRPLRRSTKLPGSGLSARWWEPLPEAEKAQPWAAESERRRGLALRPPQDADKSICLRKP